VLGKIQEHCHETELNYLPTEKRKNCCGRRWSCQVCGANRKAAQGGHGLALLMPIKKIGGQFKHGEGIFPRERRMYETIPYFNTQLHCIM